MKIDNDFVTFCQNWTDDRNLIYYQGSEVRVEATNSRFISFSNTDEYGAWSGYIKFRFGEDIGDRFTFIKVTYSPQALPTPSKHSSFKEWCLESPQLALMLS